VGLEFFFTNLTYSFFALYYPNIFFKDKNPVFKDTAILMKLKN